MNDLILNSVTVVALAKSLPPEAWGRIVDTACTTFRDLAAPLTEWTSGHGRLIKAKFDGLAETEKVIAALTFRDACQKLEALDMPCVPLTEPRTLIETIEGASKEMSADLHECWVNLLAQEMSGLNIHPEIPRILARMTSEDARILTEILARNRHGESEGLRASQEDPPQSPHRRRLHPTFSEDHEAFKRGQSVNHGILESLNLISTRGMIWEVTLLGKAFLEAVSAPKRQDENPAPPSSN